MASEKEIYENMKKNSIGGNKKEKLKLNIKRISAALAVSLVIGATATISTGCVNPYDYDMHKAYEDNLEVKNKAEELMLKYGMTPGEEYSVTDYMKIIELSDDILSGFYDLLGHSEGEKVAQALGYEDWDDYLVKNNYVDSKGRPSFGEWKKNWGNIKGDDSDELKNSYTK